MNGELRVLLKGPIAGLLVLAGLALTGCSTVTPVSSASATVTGASSLPGADGERLRAAAPVWSVSSDRAVAVSNPSGATPAATAPTLPDGATERAAQTSAVVPPAQGVVSPDPIAAPAVTPPVVLLETDPMPRVEAAHRGANRPYLVAGRQYVPRIDLTEHRERGTASWYGHAFHGRPTSSGERFDMHGLSAAHKTLPIPSYVRVTHVRNGRSVVVRVNDRGPFSSDRVIDLSLGAAQRLGITQSGTAEVELQLLAAPQGYSSAMLARRTGASSTAQADAASRASLSTADSRNPSPITIAVSAATTQPVADAAPGAAEGSMGAMRAVTADGDGASADAPALTNGAQPLNAPASSSP